jgi:DNA-binding GntR family transcriptional regulator
MAAAMPVSYKKKKDIVYNLIRSEIMNGLLAMGEHLVISNLAARLEVSTIPVREALQRLEAEGLVTITAHVGAKVTVVRLEQVAEVLAILEALQIIVWRHACTHPLTPKDLAALEKRLHEMDNQTASPAIWSFSNEQFHESLCETCGLTVTLHLMRLAHDQWRRLHRQLLADVFAKRLAASQKDAWKLYHALTAQQPNEAESLLRAHFEADRQTYQKHIEAVEKAAKKKAKNEPDDWD